MLTVLKRLACFIIDINISRDKKIIRKLFFHWWIVVCKDCHKTMIHIKRVMLLSMVVAISRVAFFWYEINFATYYITTKTFWKYFFPRQFLLFTPQRYKKKSFGMVIFLNINVNIVSIMNNSIYYFFAYLSSIFFPHKYEQSQILKSF